MPNPAKVQARVESLTPHGDRVYTVVLACPQKVRFRPGQFLHLTVDPFDPSAGFWPESRVFSIASSPGADRVRVVYSVKGRYTQKMEASLVEGAEVWLKLPYGDFVIDAAIAEGQDAVLVAGGTGIAPYVPYLELALSGGAAGRRLHLAYGVRRKNLYLFEELLQRCARELPGFSCHLFAEDPTGIEAGPGAWQLSSGPLQVEPVFAAAKGLRDPVYFLSGPPKMIERFSQGLAALGVAGERIKVDEW